MRNMLNMKRIMLLGVVAVLLAAPASAQFARQGLDYTGEPGTVAFSVDEYIYDSGVASTDVGLGAGSQTSILWAHRFDRTAGNETLSSISTSYGSTGFPGGSGITPGQAMQVHVWDDPNGDGSPSDAVLLASGADTVDGANIDTDMFQTIAIEVALPASFFIGAATVGDFPSPLDESIANGEAWIDFNVTAEYDANLFPAALNMNAIGIPGNWLLRGSSTGGGPPAPASSTWGMIALVGLVMAGSLYFMRRRAVV
jgi:hypothetical protein